MSLVSAFPGARVTDNHELHEVGAESQTQVP